MDRWLNYKLLEMFDDAYAMQVFGVVFGYLSIYRLNISYTRYWEGVTNLKIMHSKWCDACMQIFAFDQIENESEKLDHNAFCRYVGMLFIQLSAMATLVLRVDRYSPVHVKALRRAQQEEFSVAPSGIKAGPGAAGRRDSGELRRQRSALAPKSTTLASKLASVRARVTGVEARARPRALLNMRKNSLRQILSHRKASVNGRMGTTDKPLLTDEEIAFLKGFPCPVKAMVQRICRVVTTRQIAGGVIAPSPLVSRIFQELSNGSLAYEQCTRIKEVPVPFAYVQYNALLLIMFAVITPVAVACFTRNVVLSVLISILIVGGFGAMWLVTNELEDPFGSDDNDLALVHYHDVFAQSINEMCQRARLPKDQWIRRERHMHRPAFGDGDAGVAGVGEAVEGPGSRICRAVLEPFEVRAQRVRRRGKA